MGWKTVTPCKVHTDNRASTIYTNQGAEPKQRPGEGGPQQAPYKMVSNKLYEKVSKQFLKTLKSPPWQRQVGVSSEAALHYAGLTWGPGAPIECSSSSCPCRSETVG